MEWLAGEKTKVAGTFPPRNRGWTGYVEKDTAGQTNIYSVEVSTQHCNTVQGLKRRFYALRHFSLIRRGISLNAV